MQTSSLSLDSPAERWEKEFVRPLLQWYDIAARVLPWRSNPQPYRVWISEIMLQQTRVDPAIPYFERFMEHFPDVQALADADPEELFKVWEGLGYYSRARNLQKTAKILAEKGGAFPQTVPEMMKLPGIGEYTAGAILSIAFGLPVPAVDGNVIRVLSRMALYEGDALDTRTKKELSAFLAPLIPKERAGDFNQALMDLGASVCRPNGEPLCVQCPVRESCSARIAGRTADLPRKAPKKARQVQERTVFIILAPDGVLLHRRPTKGLLAGMWEYPGTERLYSAEETAAVLQKKGLCAEIRPLKPSRHIFTHIEWRMTAFLLRLDRTPPVPEESFRFVPLPQLLNEVALPSAFKAYTTMLARTEQKQDE